MGLEAHQIKQNEQTLAAVCEFFVPSVYNGWYHYYPELNETKFNDTLIVQAKAFIPSVGSSVFTARQKQEFTDALLVALKIDLEKQLLLIKNDSEKYPAAVLRYAAGYRVINDTFATQDPKITINAKPIYTKEQIEKLVAELEKNQSAANNNISASSVNNEKEQAEQAEQAEKAAKEKLAKDKLGKEKNLTLIQQAHDLLINQGAWYGSWTAELLKDELQKYLDQYYVESDDPYDRKKEFCVCLTLEDEFIKQLALVKSDKDKYDTAVKKYALAYEALQLFANTEPQINLEILGYKIYTEANIRKVVPFEEVVDSNAASSPLKKIWNDTVQSTHVWLNDRQKKSKFDELIAYLKSDKIEQDKLTPLLQETWDLHKEKEASQDVASSDDAQKGLTVEAFIAKILDKNNWPADDKIKIENLKAEKEEYAPIHQFFLTRLYQSFIKKDNEIFKNVNDSSYAIQTALSSLFEKNTKNINRAFGKKMTLFPKSVAVQFVTMEFRVDGTCVVPLHYAAAIQGDAKDFPYWELLRPYWPVARVALFAKNIDGDTPLNVMYRIPAGPAFGKAYLATLSAVVIAESDTQDRTLLDYAVDKQQPQLVTDLVDLLKIEPALLQQVLSAKKGTAGNTVLHCAIAHADETIATQLIAHSTIDTLLIENNEGAKATPLYTAVFYKKFQLVKQILDKLRAESAKYNDILTKKYKSYNEGTLLHLAIGMKSEDIIQLMIEESPIETFSIEDKNYHTPLEAAVAQGELNTVKKILERLAAPQEAEVKPAEVKKEPQAVIHALTRQNAHQNADTVLHQALKAQKWDIATEILKHSTIDTLLIEDKQGHTALYYAVKEKQSALVASILAKLSQKKDFLTSLQAPVDKATGNTLLHIAAMNEDQPTTTTLLRYGHNLADIENTAGQTPAQAAQAALLKQANTGMSATAQLINDTISANKKFSLRNILKCLSCCCTPWMLFGGKIILGVIGVALVAAGATLVVASCLAAPETAGISLVGAWWGNALIGAGMALIGVAMGYGLYKSNTSKSVTHNWKSDYDSRQSVIGTNNGNDINKTAGSSIPSLTNSGGNNGD